MAMMMGPSPMQGGSSSDLWKIAPAGTAEITVDMDVRTLDQVYRFTDSTGARITELNARQVGEVMKTGKRIDITTVPAGVVWKSPNITGNTTGVKYYNFDTGNEPTKKPRARRDKDLFSAKELAGFKGR